jgi:5-oxoprolinase (ATP-hydrolysing) subunit C
MIEILSQTALATVQDLGRFGALRWGVGTAGAMDRMALVCGNLLLGNEEGAAAIEAQVFPFEVRFDMDCAFALTGADCAAMLDGMPLPPWSAVKARSGAVLRLGLPASGRWRGARAYLCVAGGIDVPPVLGSRSTQLRGVIGGLEGRALRQGDRLKTAPPLPGSPHPLEIGLVPPSLAMPLELDGCTAVRVLPAAEYDCFTPASREALWSASWKITPQSDRYGFRLAGPNLEPLAPIEMRSHGIVPGVIQVPHGGQPIVQMCDAQPSGGYPKIATVIEADLWRLGQAPIGSRVRFIETDWDGALAAGDETRRWLAEVRRLLDLYRTRSHTR